MRVLLHISKEWGIRPSEILNWSEDEITYVVAFINYSIEQQQKPDVDS